MTEKVKSEATNEIRELTADEIAAVSGGFSARSYVPAPLTGQTEFMDNPQGHSQTVIRFDGARIGGSAR